MCSSPWRSSTFSDLVELHVLIEQRIVIFLPEKFAWLDKSILRFYKWNNGKIIFLYNFLHFVLFLYYLSVYYFVCIYCKVCVLYSCILDYVYSLNSLRIPPYGNTALSYKLIHIADLSMIHLLSVPSSTQKMDEPLQERIMKQWLSGAGDRQ